MLNWLKGLFGGKAPEVKAPEVEPAPVAPVIPAAPDLTGAPEVISEATQEVK